jgi:hypothetical protein
MNQSLIGQQEGEKPDAKLMSLLKAARGGVIEDLAVDWGVVEPIAEPVSEPEDDFEIISGQPEPKAELPPLSLFDEGPTSAETAEFGPQKILVQLPPPSFIQQAPPSPTNCPSLCTPGSAAASLPSLNSRPTLALTPL